MRALYKLSLARRVALPSLFAAMALIGISLYSCTDRGNPFFAEVSPSGVNSWSIRHAFVETQFSQFRDLQVSRARVYTPPGYGDVGLGRPYPVLYLLTPHRADENFYFHHGIQVVLDQMIDEGEIEPMIVVVFNGSSNAFGGSFYANRITNGRFQDVVTTALTAFVDTQFNTLGGPDFRAISGYEMGGYGAFRSALTSDTAFSSVSAISAPLYFTHPTAGFAGIFQDAIDEWGSYDAIDSSSLTPASGFLISAAIGFSPEDTIYFPDPFAGLFDSTFQIDSIGKIFDSSVIDTIPFLNNLKDTTIDTFDIIDSMFDTTFDVTEDTTIDTTVDTLVMPPDTMIDTMLDTTMIDTMVDTMIDTPTIIDTMIDCGLPSCDTIANPGISNETLLVYNPPTDLTFPAFPNTRTLEDEVLRFYLPFDENAQVYDTIWNTWWVPNDIYEQVGLAPQAVLDSLSDNVFIMSTATARFGHYMQDSLFNERLNSLGVNSVFKSYEGYDGLPDEFGRQYLFDVWPQILKFHSDKFHDHIPVEIRIPDSLYTKDF